MDPITGSLSRLAYVALTTILTPSADRSHIGVLKGDVSPSSVYLYTAATDSLSPETFVGDYIEGIALDRSGSHLLAGQYLVDTGMHLEGTIPSGAGYGMAFSASNPTAYVVESNAVNVIDTARQLETATIPLPEPKGNASGAVGVTPDGATLVVTTQTGFSVVALGAAQPVAPCSATVAGRVPGPIVAQVCGGSVGDVIADSRHVYASNRSLNEVEVLNLATGQLESPIFVGSQPEGLALSPDGSMLYVADGGSVQISVVDLATRAETSRINVVQNTFTYSTAYQIAITDRGEALVSSTFALYGATPALYLVNLQTGRVRQRTDFYQSQQGSPGARLVPNGDHSQVAVEEYPFDVFVYHSATDTFDPGDVLVDGGGPITLDRTGAQLLVDPNSWVPDPVTFKLDASLKVVGTIPGGGLGITYGPDSVTAYRVQQDRVDVIDTSLLTTTGAIALPELVGDASGAVALSTESNELAVVTKSGISVVPLAPHSQARPTMTASPNPTGPIPLYYFTTDNVVLSGSAGATGTITFSVWGPEAKPVCAGTPRFVSTKPVSGDGTYQSDPYSPNFNGYYTWVAEYSGDVANAVAGPTPCGGPTATFRVGVARTTLVVSSSASTGTFPLAVRYSYQLFNTGNDGLRNVSVKDDMCGPVAFASGSGGPGGYLSPGGSWTFTCSRTFNQPGMFTGSVTASSIDGDTGMAAPDARATSTAHVNCDRTITGLIQHTVTAGPGATCFDGAEVVGNIIVPPGSALYVSRSAITGSVGANASTDVTICGTVIVGSVILEHGVGQASLGRPTAPGGASVPNCPGNVVTSLVDVLSNRAGVTIAGNHVGQAIIVWDTSGGSGAQIVGNLVDNALWCFGNVPAPSDGGARNTVRGPRYGQCAAPGF